jgi:hypothetical protein
LCCFSNASLFDRGRRRLTGGGGVMTITFAIGAVAEFQRWNKA